MRMTARYTVPAALFLAPLVNRLLRKYWLWDGYRGQLSQELEINFFIIQAEVYVAPV